MDQGPLVDGEIEAGAALVREFADGWPVREAFWYKAADDAFRHLYIISDKPELSASPDPYARILDCLRRVDSPHLSPLMISLRESGEHASMSESARRLARGTVGKTVTHFARDSEGEMAVEDVYIYPLPAPAAVS